MKQRCFYSTKYSEVQKYDLIFLSLLPMQAWHGSSQRSSQLSWGGMQWREEVSTSIKMPLLAERVFNAKALRPREHFMIWVRRTSVAGVNKCEKIFRRVSRAGWRWGSSDTQSFRRARKMWTDSMISSLVILTFWY